MSEIDQPEPDAPEEFLAPPNKVGRPRKLDPDEKTLALISGLAQVMATKREVAGVLHVSETTLAKFFDDHPEVREAYDDGLQIGRGSLRRKQFKLADKNAAMAIFLGKNYLDQADKQEHSGPGGGAVPVRFEGMTSAQLANFVGRLDAEVAAREGPGGTGPETPEVD